MTNECLYTISCSIAEGKVSINVASLLSASRLIALPKQNGDIRPIAIGDVFRHVTARAICLQLYQSISHSFNMGLPQKCLSNLLLEQPAASLNRGLGEPWSPTFYRCDLLNN